MTILNGQGITSYSRTQPIGEEGDLYTTPQQVRPMINPLLAQISNVAIGTFDTDADSIVLDITEPDGTKHSYTVTRDAGAPVDASAAATAFATAIGDDADMRGIVSASTSTTNLILTFAHPGLDYVVEATPNAGTTATVTTTQAAGGSGIPFGRFVTSGGTAPDGGALVELPDAAADPIVGVLARAHAYVNQASNLASSVDSLLPGEIGPVLREGEVLMRNTGSAAAAPYGAVYAVVDVDGGNALGQASSGVDGGTQVATITPTANMLTYGVSYGYQGRTYIATYSPTDATTSVADACAGLEDALLENAPTGVTVSAGGTTEVTLTAAAGTDFDFVENTAWNLDTEAASTTISVATSAAYNKLVEGAYWVEAVAAGAVGPVHVRL